MKTTLTSLALAASLWATAQSDSARVAVDLHLAGDHLQTSANLRDASWIFILVGGSITAIASHSGDRDTAMIAGLSTVAVGYSINLFANGHERRAGAALKGAPY